MLSLCTFLFVILGLSSILDAKSSSGDSVLVLLDDAHRGDFTIFLDGLKGRPDCKVVIIPRLTLAVIIRTRLRPYIPGAKGRDTGRN